MGNVARDKQEKLRVEEAFSPYDEAHGLALSRY
jgi:hypothetical protein